MSPLRNRDDQEGLGPFYFVHLRRDVGVWDSFTPVNEDGSIHSVVFLRPTGTSSWGRPELVEVDVFGLQVELIRVVEQEMIDTLEPLKEWKKPGDDILILVLWTE